ncbi:MAG: type II secretion system F family protein [Phycisphaerae bacterium]|nr:type II secretion system F family protein [Phycisphaerae bacterium]
MAEIGILLLLSVIAIGLIAYSLMPNRRERDETVERRAAGLSSTAKPSEISRQARDAAMKNMFERAAPLLSRPVMPKTDSEQFSLRTRLANAGFRRESAPMIFLASKTAAAGVAGLIGLAFAISNGYTWNNVFGIAALGAGVGFMFPNLWLWMAVKQRNENILHGLPDSLDLLVCSVEAGLGLDAALLRVGDEMKFVYKELAEELQIATIETQMGVTRSEALTRMAERTGVSEMRALVAVITQAEKLGTSVAKALRNQAEALRTKRRQKAEERAQKTAVKLMLPLILFIFPAILIVLGGPAGIKLSQTMSAGGSGAISAK